MPAATLNPSDKGANITLSGGNLSAAGSGSTWQMVRSTNSQSSGKYYWENKVVNATDPSAVGFATSGATLTAQLGTTATGFGFQTNNSSSVAGSGVSVANAPGITFATNDFMNVAVDIGAGKAWLGKNGTYPNSGNPATGANPWVTFTAGTTLFAAWSGETANGTGTVNFGTTAFNNSAPAGFSAWTTTAYTLSTSAVAYTFTVVSAGINTARHLLTSTVSYAVALGSGLPTHTYNLAASTVTYAVSAPAILLAWIRAPANKFAQRAAAFVLQKLRITDPSLGD